MSGSRLALLCLLGGALLPGAPPGRALPPGPAVGTITAVGRQAVRDVENGILLDRGFGPGCELPDARVEPLAASLGADVELDIQLIACPSAAPPEGRCRVRIGDAVSPWIETQEGLAKVPVPLPELTGVYTPELHCESGGRELPALKTRLYLTYAPPRPIVDPPHPIWYERACTWGAGLSANATERQVADTILHQLYQFGQRRWRYATCAIQGSSCTLGTTTLPTEGLLCYLPDNLCKCPWTDLVVGGAKRNFSDCYIFSQVMQYIAATMGIGGMVPHQTFGKYKLGFVTKPTTRSLDPEFTGNLFCGERDAPCSYIFYNHDLRRWGHRVYDPTFGGIYQSSDELFSQSVTQFTDYGETFELGSACSLGIGYGGFPSFREIPEVGEPSCARFELEKDLPAIFDEADDPVLREPRAGLFVVRVEVQILTEGTYVVSGGLYERDGTTPVTLRSSSETVMAPTRKRVSGPPGRYRVDLAFSGDDVAQLAQSSGYKGPYRLKAWLRSAGAPGVLLDKLDRIVSGTLVRHEIAEMFTNPAKLGHPSNLKLNWGPAVSGQIVLQATIPVRVRRSATYGYDARLSQGETTLAYDGGKVDLAEGTPSLTVTFDLADVPPGTYDFALSLHWLDPVSPLNGFMTEIQAPQRLVPPLSGDSRRR